MDYDLYKNLLREFIGFKSISTDSTFVADVKKTADWLVSMFESNGFSVEKVSGYGNDIVLASYISSPELKTVLVYGHYDVQPAAFEEGWYKDPFELYEHSGRLFGRGVVDNKGQVLIHIVSVMHLIKTNSLGYNVKFMIEGNEETGSPLLGKFVSDYAEKLKCDFVFFSDGELTMSSPVIETGFRGIVNVLLTIKTSTKDNHSGLYGGSIPNAALVLAEVLSGMYDERGILSLPGFDNSLAGLDDKIVADSENVPFDQEVFLNNTGAKVRLNGDMNFYLQNGYLTSAEVTTLVSGYMGEGYRNAIPGEARAKINFRISPRYTSAEVLDAFRKYLEQKVPRYAEYKVEPSEAVEPISLDVNNEFTQKAKNVATDVYGKTCYFKLCGAIVPVAGTFKDVLRVPVISLGLGNEDCNMHGVNENFDLELVRKGLQLSNKFFTK